VVDLDHPGSIAIPGRDLMEEGRELSIKDRPGSAILLYSKAAQTKDGFEDPCLADRFGGLDAEVECT
jgi:hypothetical protein